jgi:Flp pilus assembly protein TadG
MKKIPENTNREKGQSLMEFSISLVVLLILIAGIVDLGRAFFTYIALRDAAQEGASYAAVSNPDPLTSGDVTAYCNAITQRTLMTTNELTGGSSSGPIDLVTLADHSEITVQTQINGTDCTSMSAADICLGSAVSVRVTYDSFPMTMPFMGTIVGSQTISLNAVVVDSILTPACQ